MFNFNSGLLQHITITLGCPKYFNLNHTDTCLLKKKDWHNTELYFFAKTRYMYAVSYEACDISHVPCHMAPNFSCPEQL